jgi:hypothetical protein
LDQQDCAAEAHDDRKTSSSERQARSHEAPENCEQQHENDRDDPMFCTSRICGSRAPHVVIQSGISGPRQRRSRVLAPHLLLEFGRDTPQGDDPIVRIDAWASQSDDHECASR